MGEFSRIFLEGQLHRSERDVIFRELTNLPHPDPVCIEVGTHKGGGSTLTILNALHQTGGVLFGLEASPAIFDEMKKTLFLQEPKLCQRFVPICGFSHKVIPSLLSTKRLLRVDFVFLDGGNNPREQIDEFHFLDPCMPVGSILMAHDALLRKGKWLRRILPALNHYQTAILHTSTEGLLVAKKTRMRPSALARVKASLILFFCSLAPLELAARFTPPGLRSALFRFLPRKLAAWIADGRTF